MTAGRAIGYIASICTHIPQAPRKNVFPVASSCRSIRVRYIWWQITPISLIYIYRCLYMAAVLAGILSRTSPAAARIFPATADELKTTKSQGNSHKVSRTERNVRRNLNDVRTKNGKIIYTPSSSSIRPR